MCTLLAAVGLSKDTPLLIAANRDERLDRPASGPRLWNRDIPFVAPVDSQAGGTWLGLNANGLFVGITNRFLSARDNSKESRGALVVDALSVPSAHDLRLKLASLDASRFNPFHLFYADRMEAHVSYSDDKGFHHRALEPGLHIITERSFSEQTQVRSEWLLQQAAGMNVLEPDGWFALLRHHDDAAPLDSVCVHAPQFNYGTRSSALIQLRAQLPKSRMWFSEGPACEATPVEQDALLSDLFSGQPYAAETPDVESE